MEECEYNFDIIDEAAILYALCRHTSHDHDHNIVHRYLVSVYRASTGNIHRAVGPDFILNVGDILYFTGTVEGFRKFCEENGLEVITKSTEAAIHAEADIQGTARTTNVLAQDASANIAAADALSSRGAAGRVVTFADSVKDRPKLSLGPRSGKMIIDVDVEFTSKRRLSMLGPDTDKLPLITKMTGTFTSTAGIVILFGHFVFCILTISTCCFLVVQTQLEDMIKLWTMKSLLDLRKLLSP